MHLETGQDTLHKRENDDGGNDVPSSPESENDFIWYGIFDESDHADNESSDSDDEIPQHVMPFMNPVFNLEDYESDADSNRDNEEENASMVSEYDLNFLLLEDSASDISEFEESDDDDDDDDLPEIPIKPQTENDKSKDTDASNNEEIDAVEGTSNNPDGHIMSRSFSHLGGQSYSTLIYDANTDCVFFLRGEDFVEPLGTSETSHSSPLHPSAFNSSFEAPDSPAEVLLTYDGPGNSGYSSSNRVRGFTQTSGYVSPGIGYYETTQSSAETPAIDNYLSSYYHASGNPGCATLQFLPHLTTQDIPRYTNPHSYYNILNNRSYPSSFSLIYNVHDSRNCPRYHSTQRQALNSFGYLRLITNDSNNYGDLVRYSTNYGVPDYRGYTSYVSENFRSGPIMRRFSSIPFNTPRFVVPYFTNYITPHNREYTGPHSIDYNTQNYSGCPGTSTNDSRAPNNQGYTSPRFMNYNNPDNQGNKNQQMTANNTVPINRGYTCPNNRNNTSSYSTYKPSTTENYGYVAPTQLDDSTPNDNQPYNTTGDDSTQSEKTSNDTKENDDAINNTTVSTACYRIPQESDNGGTSDNLDFETLQSTDRRDTDNEASSSTIYVSGYQIPATIPEFMPRLTPNSFYTGVYSNAPSANYSALENQNNQDVPGNVNYAQSSNESSASSASDYYVGPGTHYFGNDAPGTYGHGYRGSTGYGAQGSTSYGATAYNRYRGLGFNGYVAPRLNGYRIPHFYQHVYPSVYENHWRSDNSSPDNPSMRNSPTYADPSNSDGSSPSSSTNRVAYGFMMNGTEVSEVQIIPIIRRQSLNDPAPRSEHGSSHGQRGRPPPLSSTSPPISTRSRGRGRGRGCGRGRGDCNFS